MTEISIKHNIRVNEDREKDFNKIYLDSEEESEVV